MINNSNENILLDDANSPDIDRKLMGRVSADFILVSDQLKEASYQIRKRGFSDYPIFVTSRTDIALGQLLIGKTELANDWNYSATYLDEFIQRNLIGPESEESFKEHYKNADEYCCLFVINSDFAGFIYIPYPED